VENGEFCTRICLICFFCLRTRWRSFFVWRGRQCSRARAWALVCTISVVAGPRRTVIRRRGARVDSLSINVVTTYFINHRSYQSGGREALPLGPISRKSI
jgi:hypothetical protein